MIMDVQESPISFKSLRKWNTWMAVIHLIQGVLMIILGIINEDFREFSVKIYTFYRKFEELPNGQIKVSTATEELITLQYLGVFVGSFLLISALAHFLIAGPLYPYYVENLKKGINKIRWLEYGLSSSIMIVLIAIFFGITSFWILFQIFVINAMMNFFGLSMELQNQLSKEVDWTNYIFGWIAGLTPWVVITAYFLNSGDLSQIPDFVYVIYIVEAILFMSFAFNMFLQYARIGPWKDYLYGERMYQILSLVAKTLLAWLVFGGLNQPN